MSETIMSVNCECESFACTRKIDLSLDEELGIKKRGLVLIVNDCGMGPNPTD